MPATTLSATEVHALALVSRMFGNDLMEVGLGAGKDGATRIGVSWADQDLNEYAELYEVSDDGRLMRLVEPPYEVAADVTP